MTIHQQDYRSSMQAAARAFIARHQGEHLADDAALFDRAVSYLVTSLEVPAFMAPGLVHLAMTQQPVQPQARWIGIDIGSGPDVLVLIDHRNGTRVSIPRRILPERFLAHAGR